jgi:YggT family protein
VIGLTLIQLVNVAFRLFELLILVRILLSWFQVDPYNQWVQRLHRLTEPFLAPVRRRLPPTGVFDLSPLVVMLIALLLNQVIVQVLYNLFT